MQTFFGTTGAVELNKYGMRSIFGLELISLVDSDSSDVLDYGGPNGYETVIISLAESRFIIFFIRLEFGPQTGQQRSGH